MTLSVSRRQLLGSISVGGGGILAGCSLNPLWCGDHKAVVIEVEPITETPADPIQVSELPDQQRSFLVAAIEDGRYRTCPYTDVENKDALQELEKTVGEREAASESSPVYLAYRGDYYRLQRFRIEDVVIV